MPIMYTNSGKPIEQVSISSIKYLTKQLNDFIEMYEKKIYIESDVDKEKFMKLKYISKLLNEKRYFELFNDPYLLINFTEDHENYLPGYFPF